MASRAASTSSRSIRCRPSYRPRVKAPEVKVPDGNAPEVKPPDGKPPEVVPDTTAPPRTFAELFSRLSAKAQEAVSQQRQLRSADNMVKMEGIGRNADGTYDVSKANKAWEGKWMDDAAFQAARAKNVSELGTKARLELDQLKNLCDETDGTNRPNAKVGDGTTEAAVRAEAETGKPVGGVGGHAEKANTAVRTLQELVTTLRGRKQNLGPDPTLVAEIDAAIARALQRIAALRGGLDVWNNRATLYPEIWKPDGTLRNPVGPVSPLPPTPPDQDHQDGGAL